MKSLCLPLTPPAAASLHGYLTQDVERLADVIREENAALKRMDFARAGELLVAKCSAADALEAAARAAKLAARTNGGTRTLNLDVSCLSPLMTENQELHKRSARLQKRVYSLVERLHATGKRPSRAKLVQVAAPH